MTGVSDVRTEMLRDLVSSLQFRLVAGFALTIALTLAGAGIFISLATETQVERFETDQDMAQAGRVREFISNYSIENSDPAEPGAELESIVQQVADLSGLRITTFDSQGNVIADSTPPYISIPLENGGGLKEAEALPLISDGEVVGSITASNDFGLEPGAEELAVTDPDASRIAHHVDRYLLWAGIGVALLGTALVWVLARRTLAPVQRLGATARRLGGGDLSQRAEIRGPTEIRHLAQSFNTMAAELEEAEGRRRSLTADIAHELRTPTSNIQGYIEAIKDGVFQPTPETVDTIHEQALLLSRLVEDLRLLAQVDGGELQLQRTQTSVEELVQSCVDALRPRAEAKDVALGIDVADTLPELDLDPTRIAQAVGNLLDNAITHTPEGGSITVSAHASVDAVEVQVADTGPGIAPDDLPRVFDRFYRADPSRSRGTGGTGLGLTIARRLVEAHGGSIEAESVVGQGSRFIIRLPAGRRWGGRHLTGVADRSGRRTVGFW